MQKFQNSLNITEIKKHPLSGMTIQELSERLNTFNGKKLPPYRTKQIFSWIKQGSREFSEMTSIPKALIKTLEENSVIRGSSVHKRLIGRDGTVKLVLKLADDTLIETVLLVSSIKNEPENNLRKKEHYTACLSTQIGCPIGCVFCKTGSMGFIRNLDASEIVEQFLFLNDELKNSISDNRLDNRISSIVVMGMGEPLLNLGALQKALTILCDPAGFNISRRKITISTAGICNEIADMAENGPEAQLAVSIASACKELRYSLMPGTVKYPLPRLKEALGLFQKKQKGRITVETVLLKGINTRPEDARALIDFTKNLNVAINVIPWNPVQELNFDGHKLQQPASEEIKKFINILEDGGLTVTCRYRRGRSVSGACGQLGSSK